MTKTASKHPIEDLQAGDDFRASLIPRADAMDGASPMFYGWAIMDGFLAGIAYAQAKKAKNSEVVFRNQVKYTDKKSEQSDGWENSCNGHKAIDDAVGCKERQWIGTQEFLQKHPNEEFRKYHIDVRIVKITTEVVEEAERFKPK